MNTNYDPNDPWDDRAVAFACMALILLLTCWAFSGK